MMRTCRVWMALGLVVSLVGCTGWARTRRDDSLRSAPRPYAIDIPLPDGFRMVDHYEGEPKDGSRLRHRYRGWARGEAVRRFYRRQMPLVRWTLTGDHTSDGRYLLRFERDGTCCTITVVPGGLMRFRRTTVDVRVSPMVGLSRHVVEQR